MQEKYVLQLGYFAPEITIHKLRTFKNDCTESFGYLAYFLDQSGFIYIGYDTAIYLYTSDLNKNKFDQIEGIIPIKLTNYEVSTKYDEEIMKYINSLQDKKIFDRLPTLYSDVTLLKAALLILKEKIIIERHIVSSINDLEGFEKIGIYKERAKRYCLKIANTFSEKLPITVIGGVFTLVITLWVAPYLNMQYFEKSSFIKDRSESYKIYSKKFAAFRIKAEFLIELCQDFEGVNEKQKKERDFYTKRHAFYEEQRKLYIDWITNSANLSYYFGNKINEMNRKFTSWYGDRSEEKFCAWAKGVKTGEVTNKEVAILNKMRNKMYNLNIPQFKNHS